MSGLAGLGPTLRLVVRRERVALAAWSAVLAGMAAMFTRMSVQALTTPEEAQRQSEFISGSPALRMFGPTFGTSVGGYAVARALLTLAVLAALACAFTVVRTTRRDEDDGRAELVGSAAVGRQARLAASLIVVAVFAGLAGALAGLAMAAQGVPLAGALFTGAAIGSVGLTFGGIGALAAQLASTARGANGMAGVALGGAFLAAGAGNMAGDVRAVLVAAWPVWLSPLGWAQQVRAFEDQRAWPLALGIAAFVALAALAWVVAARRDFGLGVLPERRGARVAPRWLAGPFSLVWRVERTEAVAWLLAMLGCGLAFGSLAAGGLEMEGGAADWYAQVSGTTDVVPAFRTAMVQMAALAAAVHAVVTVLRGRSDEVTSRTEALHAATVTRLRWAAVHGAHAAIGAAAVLAAFGLGLALAGGGAAADRSAAVGTLVGAALAQLPAVLAVAGVGALAAGLLPRWAPVVAWPVLGLCVLLGPTFGAGLGVPDWVRDLSPFSQAPAAPAAPVVAGPLVGLAAVALVLAVAGALAASRRDLRLPA